MHVTVDIVLFALHPSPDGGKHLRVLLVRRRNPPFAGAYALPGGFVEAEETLEAAARRELQEETRVQDVYLEQLYTFGDPGRDPRGRTVTVAYYGLTSDTETNAGDDAMDAAWFPVDSLPPLAFDHAEILRRALQRLRSKVTYTLLAFQLLPREFTLTELRQTYEAILSEDLGSHDESRRRNFVRDIKRQFMDQLGVLRPTGHKRRPAGRGTPAELYTFTGRPEQVYRD